MGLKSMKMLKKIFCVWTGVTHWAHNYICSKVINWESSASLVKFWTIKGAKWYIKIQLMLFL